MSNRITIEELESYLWHSAVLLRSNIDAGAYKQYIFPLLFFKRICDVYDEEIDILIHISEHTQILFGAVIYVRCCEFTYVTSYYQFFGVCRSVTHIAKHILQSTARVSRVVN